MATNVDSMYIPSFSTTEGSTTSSSRSTRPEYSSTSTRSSDYISRPSYSTSDHISQRSHGKIRSSDRPLSSRYDYISRPAQSQSDHISPDSRRHDESSESRKVGDIYHERRRATYPDANALSQRGDRQPVSQGFSTPYEEASTSQLLKSSNWKEKHTPMHSYGFKPWNMEDYDDANAILDGFRKVDRQISSGNKYISQGLGSRAWADNECIHDDYSLQDYIPKPSARNDSALDDYIPKDPTPTHNPLDSNFQALPRSEYATSDIPSFSRPHDSNPQPMPPSEYATSDIPSFTHTSSFSRPHSTGRASDIASYRHSRCSSHFSRRYSATRSDIVSGSDICSLRSRSRSRSRSHSRSRQPSPTYRDRALKSKRKDDEKYLDDEDDISGDDEILDRYRGGSEIGGYGSDIDDVLSRGGGSDIAFGFGGRGGRGSDVASCRGSDVVDGSDGILDDDGYMEGYGCGWGSDVCGLSEDDD